MLIAIAALLFHVSPWLSAGLGDSHDGYNAATWGLGARGAVEDPIGNRLGGIQPDGFRYANHPPLLVWTLIPVTAVADDSPLALRLVPLAASVAAIVVLALLLLDAGLSEWAAAAGVLLAGTSAMFLTYGAMVDTPVFGLPFALGAVWAAQRAWQGRPPPIWAGALLGCLAALAGWQAFVAAVVAGMVALAASIRSSPGSRRAVAAILAGSAAGLAIDIGWTWWVLGGLSELANQGVSRAEIPTSLWFNQQVEFAKELFGVPLLILVIGGLLATAVASWRSTRRSTALDDADAQPNADGQSAPGAAGSVWATGAPLFATLVVTVVSYAAMFKQAAWVHSYWNFYGVAVAGVASAMLIDGMRRATQSFSPVTRTAVMSAMAAIVVLVAATSIGSRSLSDLQIQRGLDVTPLVAALPRASDPTDVVAATVGGDQIKPWLRWTTHGQNKPVELDEGAALNSDTPVLVTLPTAIGPSSKRPTSMMTRGRFALVPAGELSELIGG